MVSESVMNKHTNHKTLVFKNVAHYNQDVTKPVLGDLVVARGEIASLGPNATVGADAVVIDAKGLVALPGLINSFVKATEVRFWSASFD